MPRGALGPTIAVVALVGATWPAAVRAEPREITLPRLEVPDEVRRKAVNPERAALLNQPIELSDARDRLTLARERAAWGRLSGSLCSGCVDGRALRRTATVDPIAVLNAKPVVKPTAGKPTAVLAIAPAALRPIRPPAPTVATAAPRPTPSVPTPSVPAPSIPAPVQASAAPVRVATAGPAAAISVRRRPSIVMRRSVRPAHAHRVRFAHRRRNHSKFSRYLGRVRYTLFHWHQRHPRRAHR